jgi:poly-gamma-glutamate synthesis protein (capsule biosynthesis protein)
MRNQRDHPLSALARYAITALIVAGSLLSACSLPRSAELRLADEIGPTAIPTRQLTVPAKQSSTSVPSPTPRATAKAATSIPTGKPPATQSPARRLSSDTDTSAAALSTTLEALRATGRRVTRTADRPDLRLRATAEPGALLMHERILAPVDRFSTLLEGISLAELREVWMGSGTSPGFTTIYPSQDALDDLTAILGTPGPAVKPQPADQVSDAVWGDPMSIGIVPFERLNVSLRALRLDGLSAVDNRLDQARWPLAARAWLSAQTPAGKDALARLASHRPASNRDPSKLTVLVNTGVTAIARFSAAAIERSGDDAYVARVVGPELAAADITTINNEIPFMQGCKLNTDPDNIIFCSDPAYVEALKLSGATLVGLTGNHMNDFGTAVFSDTLDFYDRQGIHYYGGGRNAAAARAPLEVEHNGNTFGFLGANQYGPEFYTAGTGETVSAWAGSDSPGAARFDRSQMVADIAALRPKVEIIVAEMQHTEFNADAQYQTAPIPEQMADFRALSDAGADIVVGVQAHTPQAVELRGDNRIILYGLGNLYFDQVRSWATRPGLVARNAIYDGRLLNTELLVTVIDLNMQARWATAQERAQVLSEVFAASKW